MAVAAVLTYLRGHVFWFSIGFYHHILMTIAHKYNLQSTISAPRKGFSRTLCSGLPLVSLPKRFLQVGLDPLSCQKRLLYTSSRPRRRQIYAAAGNQPWDFARFVKTLYFFDAIPSPLKVGCFLLCVCLQWLKFPPWW